MMRPNITPHTYYLIMIKIRRRPLFTIITKIFSDLTLTFLKAIVCITGTGYHNGSKGSKIYLKWQDRNSYSNL
ncbi:unnamed protein product [Rhizophagus irregularis]|nr:unnamed protein product [Rhizophagus irregularis]